jgi:Transmembrane secretion effector
LLRQDAAPDWKILVNRQSSLRSLLWYAAWNIRATCTHWAGFSLRAHLLELLETRLRLVEAWNRRLRTLEASPIFITGFAFGSPAYSSGIAEIVSAKELPSAYTLAGLQMDVSGIIGPPLSAFLLPLAGVSFIFGANGLGFLLMFLAILQWKRVKMQSSLPLENFFESLTTAIRYFIGAKKSEKRYDGCDLRRGPTGERGPV